MKYKIISFLVFINLAVCGVFAQETSVKFQFGVFEETGNFFRSLKKADIQIISDKKPLQMNGFELKTDNALEVVFLIDTSASQERTLPDEKKVVEYFIDNVLKKEKDKVSFFSFSGKLTLEQDLTDDFVKAKGQLGKIKFIPPAGYIGGGIIVGTPPVNKTQPVNNSTGSTSIWDSIRQVVEMFTTFKPTDSRKVIIVISDGVNTYGKTKFEQAVEESVKAGIPIYAVGIGDESYGGVDKKNLNRLTEQTNGISIFPKKKQEDLAEQIKKIEQGLRSFYEVSFSINFANSKDKLQELKLEITNADLRKQNLQIIQPKGFFSPK